MIDCKLTAEICAVINETINSLFYKIGLWWFLAGLLVSVLFYLAIRYHISRGFEKYKIDLEKIKTKDIEIWKQQKELMFNFVNFLEVKFFNNPNLKETNTDPENVKKEKNKFFAELNTYYGQLYLVMETNILKKINEYIQGATSPVQRYYLYKELRKQLMIIMHQKFTDEDCPFMEGEETNGLIFSEESGVKKSRPAKNMDELKKAYPFIEVVEGSSNKKYKMLPFFGEEKRD